MCVLRGVPRDFVTISDYLLPSDKYMYSRINSVINFTKKK